MGNKAASGILAITAANSGRSSMDPAFLINLAYGIMDDSSQFRMTDSGGLIVGARDLCWSCVAAAFDL